MYMGVRVFLRRIIQNTDESVNIKNCAKTAKLPEKLSFNSANHHALDKIFLDKGINHHDRQHYHNDGGTF